MTTNTTIAEVVTTPTEHWLKDNLKACRKRFLVSSPYVNDGLVVLSRGIPASVKTVLLTRVDMRDFARGSSSIDSLCALAAGGTRVLGLHDLHAKVYVIDTSVALVTSANATRPGLTHNWECGVAVRDPTLVRQVASALLAGFGSPHPPQPFKLVELNAWRQPVASLRKAMPKMPRFNIPEAPEGQYAEPFEVEDAKEILSAFAGWKRLTLEAIFDQPRDEFSLEDMYATAVPLARRRYPTNTFPQDKVRQQLQILRDLGLVEFMERGRYRRTVVARGS